MTKTGDGLFPAVVGITIGTPPENYFIAFIFTGQTFSG